VFLQPRRSIPVTSSSVDRELLLSASRRRKLLSRRIARAIPTNRLSSLATSDELARQSRCKSCPCRESDRQLRSRYAEQHQPGVPENKSGCSDNDATKNIRQAPGHR